MGELKASQQELVSLKEEIDFVRKYLELEKERFGNRLHYEIDIKPQFMQSLIPPILIQPIVENAIKHGISPLIAGGTVKISVNYLSEKLCFEVSDNGKGLENQSIDEVLNKGVGLSNTNKRLIRLNGKGLELFSNGDNGLTVRFSIPLGNY